VRLELPVLFAARLGGFGRVVFHHHGDALLAPGVQHRGDVGPEGGVAAFVARHEAAVHPHLREIVDGAEVEQQPTAVGARPEVALVPADGVVAAVADAARPRLRRYGTSIVSGQSVMSHGW
jgi:hypothetical protein